MSNEIILQSLLPCLSLVEQYGKYPPRSTILSDLGNAFFDDMGAVIPRLFRCRTAQYPPAVHHFLSPNDNHYHGSAKAKWRQMSAENGWGQDDSVESSLCLLGCLTNIAQEEIKGYFTNNFLLDKKYVSPERCRPIIEGVVSYKIGKSEINRKAVMDYNKFCQEATSRQEQLQGDSIPELESSLDGSYWERN